MTDAELIKLARKAIKNSFAPYSKTRVGAVILCANGKIFTGCNVENVSYGLTICAERAAIFNAIAAGQKKFTKIAVASNRRRNFSPCGACRQVLAEFSPDIKIIWLDVNNKIKTKKLSQLLPFAFKK